MSIRTEEVHREQMGLEGGGSSSSGNYGWGEVNFGDDKISVSKFRFWPKYLRGGRPCRRDFAPPTPPQNGCGALAAVGIF